MEARNLSDGWARMNTQGKQNLVGAITQSIKIGKGEIDIIFYYLPTCKEMAKEWRKGWDSNPR